jgi:hypothetical protein
MSYFRSKLIEIEKKVPTSGARLAVTWPPGVTPQLAAMGGVSCHAGVRVKSQVPIGHSVSERRRSFGKMSPCRLFPRRRPQLVTLPHASRSPLTPSILPVQVVVAASELTSPPPPPSSTAEEFVDVAAHRLPRPVSRRSCSAAWLVSWAAMQSAHGAMGHRGYCAAGRTIAVH